MAAKDYRAGGITCNLVAPGPITTPMTDGLGDAWRETVSGLVPVGRPGTPDECAAAIAFLTSPEAGYVTGTTLPVDGGLGMGH